MLERILTVKQQGLGRLPLDLQGSGVCEAVQDGMPLGGAFWALPKVGRPVGGVRAKHLQAQLPSQPSSSS
jgi:hypothetical protein